MSRACWIPDSTARLKRGDQPAFSEPHRVQRQQCGRPTQTSTEVGQKSVRREEYCERISRTLRKLSRVKSDNVRVMRMDVRPAFAYLFKPCSIDFIHCLYPPPWPKKSDIKHRHLNTTFLQLANNRLKSGGAIRIVTDYQPYAVWIKEQVLGSGFSLKQSIIPATAFSGGKSCQQARNSAAVNSSIAG